MSNYNRLKAEFTQAQQAITNQNVASCMKGFSDLCQQMSDTSLSVKVDPDISDDKNVCFYFEGLAGSNSFKSRVSVEYEVSRFYMSGFYPVLIIRDANNTTQRYSLTDHASITRAVLPFRNFAARSMAQEAAKDVCTKAWKQAFPAIP